MIRKAAQQVATSVLRKFEVESKFTPTDHSLHLLRSNLGRPAFKSLLFLGSKSFQDEYFDHKEVLQKHNIWVRKRDKVWEAKCRRTGNFVDSAFEEVDGEHGVAQIVRETFRTTSGIQNLELHQLQPIAKFKTTRLEWLANKRFNIAIDSTDFGHRTGEVELTENAREGENSKELMATMRDDLDHFMQLHPWAFPNDGKEPVGKLSAYFASATLV